jgi:hypothetical protein
VFILVLGPYQTVEGKCSQQDIENEVYCGPPIELGQAQQVDVSGRPYAGDDRVGAMIASIIVFGLIIGSSAMMFFMKAWRTPQQI